MKKKKPIVDICYDVPITINYDLNKVIGHATFYKNRLPKKHNFKFLISFLCRGNFDKNKVTDYDIEQITLVEEGHDKI